MIKINSRRRTRRCRRDGSEREKRCFKGACVRSRSRGVRFEGRPDPAHFFAPHVNLMFYSSLVRECRGVFPIFNGVWIFSRSSFREVVILECEGIKVFMRW